jgi:hypothetical protein
MTRATGSWVGFVIGLTLACGGASAQDLLSRTLQREARVGPLSFPQTVSGVPLTLQASGFFIFSQVADKLQIDVRLAADLSDVQSKIGALVASVPLPSDKCGLSVRIGGSQLPVDGNKAVLKSSGEATGVACVFGVPQITITQSFDANLPFTLTMPDPNSVSIKAETPGVQLHGLLSGAPDLLQHIFGVDINAKVRDLLNGAIKADNLSIAIPEDLKALNLVVTTASFVSNGGALAATAQMRASLDAKALSELVRALVKAPPG